MVIIATVVIQRSLVSILMTAVTDSSEFKVKLQFSLYKLVLLNFMSDTVVEVWNSGLLSYPLI